MSMENAFSEAFESEAGKPASTGSMENASQIVEEMVSYTKRKDELEETLKGINSHLHYLKTVKVPEALSVANQAEFTLADGDNKGWKVKVDDFVSGSLPKEPEARKKAIELLESYQASDLIKTEVSVSFGRGDAMKASDLYSKLKEKGYEVEKDQSVHPQTLLAFGRERMKKGLEIEGEVLGLHIGRAAKLSPPKTKSLKKESF